ncbi:hypothetical protein RBB50_000816 [Rhinocladiella similis]
MIESSLDSGPKTIYLVSTIHTTVTYDKYTRELFWLQPRRSIQQNGFFQHHSQRILPPTTLRSQEDRAGQNEAQNPWSGQKLHRDLQPYPPPSLQATSAVRMSHITNNTACLVKYRTATPSQIPGSRVLSHDKAQEKIIYAGIAFDGSQRPIGLRLSTKPR